MPKTIPVILWALLAAAPLKAQFIPIKTVPVAAGDQFLLFPSARLAMGGVTLALNDPEADPFSNPATGHRFTGARIYTTPTFYGISQDNGGARSLPVALLARSGDWFGGGAVALQQLEAGQRFPGVFLAEPARLDIAPFTGERLSDRSANNLYAFGFVGRRLPNSRVSLGVSGMVADLHALDGVEMLYAMSDRLEQAGHLADLRAGVSAELPGARSLEVVGLYTQLRMTHDVSYLDWTVVDSLTWDVQPRTRIETNRDYTDTWGLHVAYDQPLSGNWRIGGALTGNVKSHPKIPNYDLMNIPRDPGTSWAYNIGVGIASIEGPTTFGIDVIYEPIRSHTWAEAAVPTPSPNGVIPLGAKTVDNRFTFSNATIRLGVARDIGLASMQLGLQMHSISYTLLQRDFVQALSRRQSEQWMEWTPSWGLSVRLPDLELRYVGRVTTGTGRPGVAWDGATRESFDAAAAADILLAPSGPLTLTDAHVLTHQVSVSLPIR